MQLIYNLIEHYFMKNFLITGAWSGIGKEIALELWRTNNDSNFYLVWWRRSEKLTETKSELSSKNTEICNGDLFSQDNNKIRDYIKSILELDNLVVINSAAIMVDSFWLDERKKLFDRQNDFVEFLSREISTHKNKLVHISSSTVSLKKELEKHFLLNFVIKRNIRHFKYRVMKAIQEEIISFQAKKNSIIIRPWFTYTDFAPLRRFKNIDELFLRYIQNLKIAKIIHPKMNMPVQNHIFQTSEVAKKIVEIISSFDFNSDNNVFEII